MTTVIAAPPPTAGIHVLQQLNIVENYDLAKMGYHSADALHVLIEATKLAGADRRGMGGDPDFVDMPMTGLLSKPYAAKRKALIDMNKAMAVWSKILERPAGQQFAPFQGLLESGIAVGYVFLPGAQFVACKLAPQPI